MIPAMMTSRMILQRGAPLSFACAAALAACTNTSAPAQNPDPGVASTPSATAPATAPADEGVGFASPPQNAEIPEDPPPPDDPALAARVREKFGESCRLERVCEDMAGVDCNAAADGPYYYVRKADLSTLATCGGACMSGRCTNCPPQGWTCAAY